MNTSSQLENEKKRELSPEPAQAAKKTRLRDLGNFLLESSDEDAPHEQLITLEAYNIDNDEDDEEDDDLFNGSFSLSGKPACRSILNELLSSVNQDEYLNHRKQRSINSSVLGIHGILEGEDEEDEDEKTTLPMTPSQNKPPVDEVDALFNSTNADRLDNIRQHQHLLNENTPRYITNWPNFITRAFFEQCGPKDRPIEHDENFKATNIGYFDTEFSKGYMLGNGEHSVVYYTRQLSTGEVCATKKSKRPFTGWEDRWLQLIEVDALLKVKYSKHCVQILRSWEEQGHLYIQTELCTSGNLEEYLNYTKRKIPENIIWKIFYETVLGISDIHKENIAHLDLKPSNILIDNYGFIRIADFGVSIQTPAVSCK
ncbi:hypothetical protein G6F56_007349 [Rhizopus delemar]|nr:hypothetical protein G6F56_007349 [Rhizopus delemar]